MQRCPDPIQSFLSTAQRHSMAQSDAGTVLLFSRSQSLPVSKNYELYSKSAISAPLSCVNTTSVPPVVPTNTRFLYFLKSKLYEKIKRSVKEFLVEAVANVVSAGFHHLNKKDLEEK